MSRLRVDRGDGLSRRQKQIGAHACESPNTRRVNGARGRDWCWCSGALLLCCEICSLVLAAGRREACARHHAQTTPKPTPVDALDALDALVCAKALNLRPVTAPARGAEGSTRAFALAARSQLAPLLQCSCVLQSKQSVVERQACSALAAVPLPPACCLPPACNFDQVRAAHHTLACTRHGSVFRLCMRASGGMSELQVTARASGPRPMNVDGCCFCWWLSLRS